MEKALWYFIRNKLIPSLIILGCVASYLYLVIVKDIINSEYLMLPVCIMCLAGLFSNFYFAVYLTNGSIVGWVDYSETTNLTIDKSGNIDLKTENNNAFRFFLFSFLSVFIAIYYLFYCFIMFFILIFSSETRKAYAEQTKPSVVKNPEWASAKKFIYASLAIHIVIFFITITFA